MLNQHQHPAQSGMTIIEVIVATAVLAVGLLIALGQFGTLNQMRQTSQEMATAKTVVFALSERFQGCRWDTIGSNDAAWSLLRAEPGTVATPVNAPLTDDINLSVADRATRGLQTLGLALNPTGLKDFKVYVEFYRAVPMTDADGNNLIDSVGIMSGGGKDYNDPAEFRERFYFDFGWEQVPAAKRSAVTKARGDHLLGAATLPATQVGEHDPVAIRILATWKNHPLATVPDRAFATLTARKR